VYNNAIYLIIGETPFFTNYRYNPTLIGEPQNKVPTVEEAADLVDTINYLRT
jgi:hypothetical protein